MLIEITSKIGAELIAAAKTAEIPPRGWNEASDSDKHLALITALKAGNFNFAFLIAGPFGAWLQTETNTADLTVADALEVFATQSAKGVLEFIIERVDGVISALIASLRKQGGDPHARKSYVDTLGNLVELPRLPSVSM